MDHPRAFIVDAFTHASLLGNAAAVVVLVQAREAEWMQRVAAEFQLSETAFLHRDAGANIWQLRWFTPSTEVNLCGHATLASAHVLWQHLQVDRDEIRFATRSGGLSARREAANDRIQLDFPRGSLGAVEGDASPAERLGLAAVDVQQAGEDLLVVLDSPAAVRQFQPDLDAITALPWRGLIISARSEDGEVDFVSRFFAPNVGVNEDPVTGSIHCCLAPYWAERLNKQELLAEQYSARGGRLHLQLTGERVLLSGAARTFLEGQLCGLEAESSENSSGRS